MERRRKRKEHDRRLPLESAAGAGGGGCRHAPKHGQQPEVLQQLYARIEPLGVHLERVLRPPVPLLQAGDLQDYRYVLERCLVAQPSASSAARRRDAPRSPASAPRLASSQPEVVRQVIETLFRESANPEHMLALGKCRPRVGGMGSNAFHGVEQLIPSSAASALQTKPWVRCAVRLPLPPISSHTTEQSSWRRRSCSSESATRR